ncbi:MAG: arylamine N-acetyltransferase [Clostridia bacterium]|nr:arylamine N-acetyltransferase [Clostridia bacterium]
MFTIEQIKAAFARIGMETPALPVRPTAELLSDIQYNFAAAVPYENLDILAGIPLSLEEDALYDKIVTRHRGGYCFEVNGFLTAWLRSMGYEVTEYMARYLRGETTIPMRRHRVLVVTCDDGSRWIVDAGIGQSAFRRPLPFAEGAERTENGETYHVVRKDFYGWVIEDWHNEQWRPFYGFTEEVQLNLDYIMPSFWCEKHPDSPFTKANIISLKTDTGRFTIDGNTYRCFDGDTVTEKELTDDQIPAVLDEVFGIRL